MAGTSSASGVLRQYALYKPTYLLTYITT